VWFEGKIVKTRWFGPKREDQYKAKAWEDDIKNGLQQQKVKATQNVTLAQWHGRYLDSCYKETQTEGLAYKTYDEKYAALDRFVDQFGDDFKVEDLLPSSVLSYMQDLEIEVSGNRANKDRKNLSAGWNWAKTFISNWPIDAAHSNPFLVVPRRKEARDERYVPSSKDLWAVCDLSEGQDRVILTAAYYLAARRGELWRLEWRSDIDLTQKRVRLRTQKTADGQWKYTWLPMADELYRAMLWQWEKVRTKAHDFVFWSQAMNQHQGNPFVSRQKWMAVMCAQAGVKHFGMHAIRHRRATDLYESGFKLGQIQTLLRHASPSITERYLKSLGLDLDNLQEVVDSTSRSRVVNIGESN
jgi:integrase